MDKLLLLLFLCLVLLVHSWRTIQSYSLFIVRCVPGDGASKSIILITTTKKKNNDFFGFNDVAPMISILFRDISEENNIYLFIIYKSKHLIKSQIKLFMKLLWNKLFLSFFLWRFLISQRRLRLFVFVRIFLVRQNSCRFYIPLVFVGWK